MFKRLLRFMVRRRRTCHSKIRSDKIPLADVPQVFSETTTDPRNDYLPSETEDSVVQTEVSPAPQCLLDNNVNEHGSECVLVQPEKHDTYKEKSRVSDCESSDSTINKECWENLGCSSDDMLCDLKEEHTVPKINSQGPVGLDPESLCFQDWGIKGIIQVANMAYEKHVMVRWSVDGWMTWVDTDAAFHRSLSKDTDLFKFTIPSQTKIVFAVRYRAAGQEMWDNNSGLNYDTDLIPV